MENKSVEEAKKRHRKRFAGKSDTLYDVQTPTTSFGWKIEMAHHSVRTRKRLSDVGIETPVPFETSLIYSWLVAFWTQWMKIQLTKYRYDSGMYLKSSLN
jgi:hypothetical protein